MDERLKTCGVTLSPQLFQTVVEIGCPMRSRLPALGALPPSGLKPRLVEIETAIHQSGK